MVELHTNTNGDSSNAEINQTSIINISDLRLTDEHISLLSKSLKFNITKDLDENAVTQFRIDIGLFVQKIKNIDFHEHIKSKGKGSAHQAENIDIPIAKNKQDRRTKTYNNQIYKLENNIHNVIDNEWDNLKNQHFKHNITRQERHAFHDILNNFEIVVREADKGSAVVLMNTPFYIEAVNKVLSDVTKYNKLDITVDKALNRLVRQRNSIVRKFKSTLHKKEVDYITNFECELAHIYLTPKVHKSPTIIKQIEIHKNTVVQLSEPDDLPFRPIHPGGKCPLNRLAAMVNILIQPFTKKVTSYIRDTWHFLDTLPKKVKLGTEIISLDIKNLYTNIDNKLGLKALEYYLDKYPELIHERLGKEFILSTAEMLQNNIIFEFQNGIYIQFNGVPMGRSYGPVWATLSIGFLEETKLYPSIRRTFPKAADSLINSYGRFQDDTFILNELGIDSNQLLKIFNELHQDLVFTMEHSNEQLSFLDVLIYISNNKLETTIYTKPTDSFNYLNFNSNHPAHVKRNIPYCLARRIKGIVSEPQKRLENYTLLKEKLLKKFYPIKLIEDALHKAENLDRESIIKTGKERIDKDSHKNILTLITTHHPKFTDLAFEIKKTTQKANIKSIKEKEIIHSRKQTPNLKRLLMKTKNLTKTEKVVSKCNRGNCGLCQYNNIIEGKSVTLINGKVIKPNASLSCKSKNVVYCIICPSCKEFYIGECKDFNLRMNLHRAHSDPNNSEPPLLINKHLRTCSPGSFHVFPFYKVQQYHEIARQGWESHFQKIFKPTLH